MIALMILPILSFFGMMLLVSVYGEIWINKNGMDEYLLVLAIITTIGVGMKARKIEAKMLKAWVKGKRDKANKLRQKLIQKYAKK